MKSIQSGDANLPTMSSKNTATFPPMSTLPPKPLSQHASKASSTPKPPLYPSVDYKNLLTNFFKEACPEKVAEVESILHKYKVSETEITRECSDLGT